MSTIVSERPSPCLVSAAEAAQMLCMKPWPVVRLCESGELKFTKIDDGEGRWHYAISVESIRDYARKVTA